MTPTLHTLQIQTSLHPKGLSWDRDGPPPWHGGLYTWKARGLSVATHTPEAIISTIFRTSKRHWVPSVSAPKQLQGEQRSEKKGLINNRRSRLETFRPRTESVPSRLPGKICATSSPCLAFHLRKLSALLYQQHTVTVAHSE